MSQTPIHFCSMPTKSCVEALTEILSRELASFFYAYKIQYMIV